MRHNLLAAPVTAGPFGMGQAAPASLLIAAAGGLDGLGPGRAGTGGAAVTLAPVAVRTDDDLSAAAPAEKEAARGFHRHCEARRGGPVWTRLSGPWENSGAPFLCGEGVVRRVTGSNLPVLPVAPPGLFGRRRFTSEPPARHLSPAPHDPPLTNRPRPSRTGSFRLLRRQFSASFDSHLHLRIPIHKPKSLASNLSHEPAGVCELFAPSLSHER
jgi:hypothetical protein